MEPLNKSLFFYLTLALITAVHLAGLFIPIMDPDAAVYATLSKTIAETGNFTDLVLNGQDWLDKPHFPFWVTALIFKLFGISTVTYKLPALAFTVLAAFYTYRLAKRLYSTEVAQWAVLILLTALHLIMSDADVRAEPFLTGLIAGGVYHFYRLRLHFSWGHLLLGAAFAAGAMMTKGIFTLVPIAGAIGLDLLLERDWRGIFSWKWLLAAGFTLLFTLPELLSLYVQFDQYPEKVIFGKTGVSGVKFFFWDSQFGRFFNTGPIKGEGDPFFAFHTLLWAFAPWALLMYAALFTLFRRSIFKLKGHVERSRNASLRFDSAQRDNTKEFYTLGASLPTLLLFTLSSFQLPHYLNIVFPFLAIFTAKFITEITSRRSQRAYAWTQGVQIVLLILIIFVGNYFFQPTHVTPWFWGALAAVLGAGVAMLKSTLATVPRFFYLTCLAAAGFNFYTNLVFYPAVLTYQAAGEAANYANLHFPQVRSGFFGNLENNSFEFYRKTPVRWYARPEAVDAARRREPLLLYTAADQLPALDSARIPYREVAAFPHFHVTTLTPEFVNHRTRQSTLERHVLIRVERIE